LDDVYVIEKILGEGTYGQVFQARRKLDGTLVALKSMPRIYTGKTDFEREVAALQLLSKPPSHAHIVQLYELHRDEKNYYLAMELIEGGELLRHLIESGPYSEGLAASFLRQFAEAICFVHDNGLVHADLKPENLLLSSNDMEQAKLKVVDFGCARSHDLSRKELQLPMQEFAVGCSFLHMVALGNQFELEKMLQERPALVNFRDYDFRTPLHLAASEGHVDLVRYLIMKGARVNRSDRWGGKFAMIYFIMGSTNIFPHGQHYSLS
jgi:serine/threonine protein kinase